MIAVGGNEEDEVDETTLLLERGRPAVCTSPMFPLDEDLPACRDEDASATTAGVSVCDDTDALTLLPLRAVEEYGVVPSPLLEMKADDELASAPGEMICTGAEMVGVYDVEGRCRLLLPPMSGEDEELAPCDVTARRLSRLLRPMPPIFLEGTASGEADAAVADAAGIGTSPISMATAD